MNQYLLGLLVETPYIPQEDSELNELFVNMPELLLLLFHHFIMWS